MRALFPSLTDKSGNVFLLPYANEFSRHQNNPLPSMFPDQAGKVPLKVPVVQIKRSLEPVFGHRSTI